LNTAHRAHQAYSRAGSLEQDDPTGPSRGVFRAGYCPRPSVWRHSGAGPRAPGGCGALVRTAHVLSRTACRQARAGDRPEESKRSRWPRWTRSWRGTGEGAERSYRTALAFNPSTAAHRCDGMFLAARRRNAEAAGEADRAAI
jgi:hypothetical protein